MHSPRVNGIQTVRRRAAVIAWIALMACVPARAREAGPLRITAAGRFDFEAPAAADRSRLPEELSGIAWMGGSRYVAVGDEHACLHFLAIRLDENTGRVVRLRFEAPLPLKDERGRAFRDSTEGQDREGICFDRAGNAVWISNERTGRNTDHSSVARHSLRDGRRTRLLAIDSDPSLRAFGTQRLNRGLESLTGREDGRETWTANEGPLAADGRPASDSTGGVVRLVRLDGAMRPVAQYAYVVDPYPARIARPRLLRGSNVSGLSDLLLLPDGRLLALERTFAGDSTGAAGLRIRIYEVDVSRATDVSRPPYADGLAGKSYAPAWKRMLWEEAFGLSNSNFEGITLGPRLRNGDRALLLVADNNGGTAEAVYALRLSGIGG